MQLLPLDKHVIGTGDACETLPHADPEVCKKFKIIADRLGLAEHEIQVKGGDSVRLHFGADVECHEGKDGKLYVLDTAYVFRSRFLPSFPFPQVWCPSGYNIHLFDARGVPEGISFVH